MGVIILEDKVENVYEIMEIPEERQLFMDAKIMAAFRIKDTKKIIESIINDEHFTALEKLLIIYKYGRQSAGIEMLDQFTKGLQGKQVNNTKNSPLYM